MKDQNLINENELYLVDGSEIDKYTFTATAGQNTFTIPFEFDGSSSLTLYYNGVMMKENDNYTISGNVITLVDWTAEEGDYITVMGIQGAAAIDFAKDADKYMKQMEDKAAEVKADLTSTATTAKNDITSTASTSKTEINTIVSTGKNDLNNLISTLPDNWNNVMDKNSANVMGANGKITMDSSYVPSGDNDLVTMKYVSENSYKVGDTLTTARTDLGNDWLLCNGDVILTADYPKMANFITPETYRGIQLPLSHGNTGLLIDKVFDIYFIKKSSGYDVTKDFQTIYSSTSSSVSYTSDRFFECGDYIVRSSSSDHTNFLYINKNETLENLSKVKLWKTHHSVGSDGTSNNLCYSTNGTYFYCGRTNHNSGYNKIYRGTDLGISNMTEIPTPTGTPSPSNDYDKVICIQTIDDVLFVSGYTDKTQSVVTTWYSIDNGENFNIISFPNGFKLTPSVKNTFFKIGNNYFIYQADARIDNQYKICLSVSNSLLDSSSWTSYILGDGAIYPSLNLSSPLLLNNKIILTINGKYFNIADSSIKEFPRFSEIQPLVWYEAGSKYIGVKGTYTAPTDTYFYSLLPDSSILLPTVSPPFGYTYIKAK